MFFLAQRDTIKLETMFSILLTIIGLSFFEIINSIDNAIINVEVLSTMGARARKWFVQWGFLVAVLVVRGLLPLVIVWSVMPSLGFWGVITATFSGDPMVRQIVEYSSPILLVGGGTFLLFLFFHWLFVEEKEYGLPTEPFFHKHAVWFYSAASLLLVAIVGAALSQNPLMALSAVIGSSAFFIAHGFQEQAEQEEQRLKAKHRSDISKLIFLEIIDATFSIDSVLGAFAFTLSVPLIFLGNGIGAFVLRQLTLGNIDRIRKYRYLKNGAMYAIFVLSVIMIAQSFGAHVPEWLSPLATFTIVGYFFLKSKATLPAI